SSRVLYFFFFFFQAEDGIRDRNVTGVQTCALPIFGAFAQSYSICGNSRTFSFIIEFLQVSATCILSNGLFSEIENFLLDRLELFIDLFGTPYGKRAEQLGIIILIHVFEQRSNFMIFFANTFTRFSINHNNFLLITVIYVDEILFVTFHICCLTFLIYSI